MIDKNNNSKMKKSAQNQRRKSTAAADSSVSHKKRRVTILPVNERAGQLFSFGNGDCGQLGLGPDIKKRKYPCLVEALKNKKIVQVVAGGMHTVALDEDGAVWTFGVNDDFALGRKTKEEEDAFIPGVVMLKKKIVQISAGDAHSAALTDDGEVYAWGAFKDMNGNFGLLPGRPEKCLETPQLLSEPIGVKVFKIASGDNHLVMLAEGGKVFSCGTGEQGQLGRVTEPDRKKSPEGRVTRNRAKALAEVREREKTTPVASKRDILLTPAEVKVGRKKIKDVFTGSYSTYFLAERGEVLVCGLNNYEQLGLSLESANADGLVLEPTKSLGFKGNKWKKIAAGQHHAVALDQEGKVYTLGRGSDARLGLGANPPEKLEQPTLVPVVSNFTCVEIAAGLSTGYAVTTEGKIYSWGFGGNFQLGSGSEDDLEEPEMMEYMVIDAKKVELNVTGLQISAGGQHVSLILNRLP